MQLRAVPNVCASQQTVELGTATLQLPRPRWTSATSPTSPCPCFRTLPCHSRRERGANSSIDGDDGRPDDCYEGQDDIQSYVDVNMDIDADIDFYNTTDDDEFAASDRDSIVPETNNDEGEASTPIGWDLDFAELGNDYTDLDDNAFMPLLSDSEFDASSGDLDHLVGPNDSVVESLADVVLLR